MNIECGVSPGVVVTWSLQWSPLHPMFLAGKCSVTGPGLGGQSPGLGPLVTRVWPHPGARPVSVSGHTPEHAHRLLLLTRAVHVTRRARAVTA